MKRVTIKDVAKEAGVSYATVSRALSGSPEIGEETRQRVLRISKEMGYTPNSIARSLVVQSTRIFGLIVGRINNPFMAEIAFHVERVARERGYHLMLCNSSSDLDQEEESYRLLVERQVDGIIIVPTAAQTYERLKPYLKQMPTVFVSENLRDLRESYVTIDNYKGTYMATEYLRSLGHEEIAYLGRRAGSVTHRLRSQGYEEACHALGIKPIFVDSPYNHSSITKGYAVASQLFKKKSHSFTAILASTDSMALGVIKAANEAGLSVPEDFSLVGFDNISYSGLPKIELTTVEQPKSAMASVAVDMLINKITDPTAGYSHRILEPSLIIRSSCRALNR